jgi:hypothetical protein
LRVFILRNRTGLLCFDRANVRSVASSGIANIALVNDTIAAQFVGFRPKLLPLSISGPLGINGSVIGYGWA